MTRAQKVVSFVLLQIVVIAVVGWRAFAVSGVGSSAPEITGQVWLNAAPIRVADLKDKVVLVEFWTFGCYNCRNVEPHVQEWHNKYAEQGLVVIGVHTLNQNTRHWDTFSVACAARTIPHPLPFVRMAHATKERTIEHLYESRVA